MKSFLRIFKFTRELWPLYMLVSGLSVVVALFTQAIPLLTKSAIDHISAGLSSGVAPIQTVLIIVVAIFLSDVGQTIISNINGYFGDILAARLRKLLSTRYYAHMMELPQRYFDTELSGKIINRLSRGVEQLASYMQFFANNFLQLIVSTILSVAIVAHYSWQVALILLALFPIYAVLTTRSSKKWQKYQEQVNEYSDLAGGKFAESIGQVKVVKSFVHEKQELTTYSSLLTKIIKTTRPQSRYWHSQDILRRVVLAILFLVMYTIIFVGTAKGTYSIGTMVLLIQFVQLVRIPLFSLSFYVDNTQRAISNSKDYFKAMDETIEIADKAGASELVIKKGAIKFNDVSFGYDAETAVLKTLDFAIQPGSKVALVGESGQGKTTITSLLLRFYEPVSGSITIDDQDITEVTQASLRENIAVVFQEPALFSGTIAENISYANPRATTEAVEAAAKAANAHEFINKFEHGYASQIGERGLKLSGGQKQRIAIARALLKDAPILILDEATSSLDTKSERQVQQALERLMHGRTTLIIAHRLSTIQTVDTIVTVKDGRADEIGSPQQLAKSKGIYAELLNLQQSHTAADIKKLHKYDIE